MTFSRAKPLGAAPFDPLTSAEFNHIDLNQSRALDGMDGGIYPLGGVLDLRGEGIDVLDPVRDAQPAPKAWTEDAISAAVAAGVASALSTIRGERQRAVYAISGASLAPNTPATLTLVFQSGGFDLTANEVTLPAAEDFLVTLDATVTSGLGTDPALVPLAVRAGAAYVVRAENRRFSSDTAIAVPCKGSRIVQITMHKREKPTPLGKGTPARSEQDIDLGTVPRKGPNVMTMSEMLDYDEPVNWLVQQWIAPGRPTLLYGEKDAAKSLVAQDLFVAISTGRKWLGAIELQRRGKCIYLDFEPKVPAAKRIRQLTGDAEAKSPGLIESEAYTRFPVLSGQGVAEWLEVVATGAALVIVDSLAAASPGVEGVSEILCKLTKVGDKKEVAHGTA